MSWNVAVAADRNLELQAAGQHAARVFVANERVLRAEPEFREAGLAVEEPMPLPGFTEMPPSLWKTNERRSVNATRACVPKNQMLPPLKSGWLARHLLDT